MRPGISTTILAKLRSCALAAAASLVLALSILPAAPLRAEQATPPAALSVQALEGLISTIEDEAERKKFVARLKALVAAHKAGNATGAKAEGGAAGLMSEVSERARKAASGFAEAAAIVLELPELWRALREHLADPDTRGRWLTALWRIAAALAAGALANGIAHLLFGRPRRAVEGRSTDTVLMRLPFLVARTFLELFPIAAFAAGAYAALPIIGASESVRLIVLTFVYANVLGRLILAGGRMVLAPKVPTLRVLPLADRDAAYMYFWLRRIANTAVYGYFLAEASLLFGLPAPVGGVLLKFVGLVVAAMLAVLVLQNRRNVAAWLRGDGTGKGGLQALRNRFGDVWHVLTILYIAAVYGVWVLAVEGGFEYLLNGSVLTLVILAAARLAAAGAWRAIDRGFSLSDELKARYPLLEERTRRYLPALRGVLQTVIYLFAAIVVLQAWGLDTFEWLASDAGRNFLGSAISIAIILVTALVVYEGISSAIETYLAKGKKGAARRSRMRTLLPLARRAMFILLLVMVTMVILSELGIDIGPLLAGAGVLGLAIGFGAQTLAKDIITGIFILIEDTVAVGDLVEVAGHSGTVEAISIRTIRLRDLAGEVHTVPFSEVSTVRNKSKDFSYAVIEAGVGYREDTDEVAALLQQIGAELQKDPGVGGNILEPFELHGVNELGDSAVVVRGRLKTKPGTQFGVRRAFYGLMKKTFDEHDIEIPYPHMTLYFGEDKEGKAPAAFVRIGEAAKGSKTAAPGKSKKPAKRPTPPAPESRARVLDEASGGDDG